MYISSNEISSQNQLAIVGVIHKLIYMFKPLNFINVGQSLFSYSNTFCKFRGAYLVKFMLVGKRKAWNLIKLSMK